MDSNTNVLYSAAGLPALISTRITFIYFFLKACHYVFHAISHQTEGRVATAMPGCGQQEHSANMGKEGHPEICELIPGYLTEQYGGGTQRSPGSVFLPRRRKDVCLPSRGDAPEHTEESTFPVCYIDHSLSVCRSILYTSIYIIGHETREYKNICNIFRNYCVVEFMLLFLDDFITIA